MPDKQRLSIEEKIKIIQEYLNGKGRVAGSKKERSKDVGAQAPLTKSHCPATQPASIL